MKRKQFHITLEDERILKDIAKERGISEAEVVREAIRAYEANHLKRENPLLLMAEEAKNTKGDLPYDWSKNHDKYLMEILENEE